MQAQDHKKITSSGPESHGVHLCNKCGWPFPNPHPSARHRRAHKRVCGTIEGYKTHLDGSDNENLSDDDSKTTSMEVAEKAAGVTISRLSSSGVGSRSSRSTRSEEDVFSDAVTDFADAPAAVGLMVGRETADAPQDISEDVGVTQLGVEKTVVDAGDLYPVTSGNGTQVLNVECSGPEMERAETDMLSAHHSLDDANVLQCSDVAAVLASEEKQSIEVTTEKKFESDSHNTTKTLEAAVVPQKVNGDNMEYFPAGAAMEETGNQGDGFGDKDDCSREVNFAGQVYSSEKGMVETALGRKSEDIAIIPADVAANSSEAASMPQKVNGDTLEFTHANATMEAKRGQGDEFDAHNDCFPETDFVKQINSVEEDPNSSCNDSFHVLVVSDALPLNEQSETMLEVYEDCKTDNLPDAATLDLAKEAECVEHGKGDVSKEAFSAVSQNKNSKDIFSETIHKEDDFAEELTVEKKMERTETHATDADMCGSSSVIVHTDKNDNKIGQGETVTYPQEQNLLVFVDTNLQGVSDNSGDLEHSVEDIKPVHDDSERDEKDAQIFDALGADSAEVTVEQIPLTRESGNYDLRSIEVEEKLPGSTLPVAQSDEPLDDKVEVQRDDEHGFEPVASSKASLPSSDFQMVKLQDSETAVKDVSSSSEQMVGEDCVNLLGSTLISDVGHNEENCVQEASDAVDVSLVNNVMNNGNKQDENEVSEDAKKLESFGEKASSEERLGKVDLGLISDKDENIDLTQTTENKSEAGVHVEALSAVEDRLAQEKIGGGSDFADGDGNVAKKDEVAPELDAQVDSVSLTDSLECNWGSVSVLSGFSDAPAATETGSQLSHSSVQVEKATLQPKSKGSGQTECAPGQKGDGGSVQTEGPPEAQTLGPVTSEANASGSKKSEEIIAKVTNWSTDTGKQHMPLKSFLGESSPNPKGVRAVESQKTEKIATAPKEAADEAAGREMPKEWNSPARYPSNIKREKGKVRSRPYWAPFICCSSVQTS